MSLHETVPHIPVLLAEVLAAVAPAEGTVVVDATFGAGGYTRAFLAAGATVHAFDRDPDAIAAGLLLDEATGPAPSLSLHHRRFSELSDTLRDAGVGLVDGVVLDIGVSSMQLDQAERGFAFQTDGPLDMRMARDGESAADFLNTADEAQIADVIYRYGEERQSRRIARAVVAARPVTTTRQFAEIVRRALGWHTGASRAYMARMREGVKAALDARDSTFGDYGESTAKGA